MHDPAMQHAKTQARSQARSAIAAMGPAGRAQASAAIERHLAAWMNQNVEGTRPVLAFWPLIEEEPDVRGLLGELAANGRLALPRVHWSRGTITPVLVRETIRDLEAGPRAGLMQPTPHCVPVALASLGAVLVPGVAFDPSGGRVGRGKGFYDRFLADLPPETPTIGVAFACQVLARVPMSEADKGVEWLVTDTRASPTR